MPEDEKRKQKKLDDGWQADGRLKSDSMTDGGTQRPDDSWRADDRLKSMTNGGAAFPPSDDELKLLRAQRGEFPLTEKKSRKRSLLKYSLLILGVAAIAVLLIHFLVIPIF